MKNVVRACSDGAVTEDNTSWKEDVVFTNTTNVAPSDKRVHLILQILKIIIVRSLVSLI